MPLNFLSVERNAGRMRSFVRNYVPARDCKGVCLIDTRSRIHCCAHNIDERRMLVESAFESRAINRRLSRDGEVSVSQWIIRSNHDGNCDSEIIAVLHIYSANSMDNYYKLAKNNDCIFIIHYSMYNFIKVLITLTITNYILYITIKYYASMFISLILASDFYQLCHWNIYLFLL